MAYKDLKNRINSQINLCRDYMNKVSEEINELLQEKGSVSIAELTNAYELPNEFIQQVIFKTKSI